MNKLIAYTLIITMVLLSMIGLVDVFEFSMDKLEGLRRVINFRFGIGV